MRSSSSSGRERASGARRTGEERPACTSTCHRSRNPLRAAKANYPLLRSHGLANGGRWAVGQVARPEGAGGWVGAKRGRHHAVRSETPFHSVVDHGGPWALQAAGDLLRPAGTSPRAGMIMDAGRTGAG